MFSKFLESSNESQFVKLIDSTSAIIRGQTTKYVEHSTLINLNQKVNKGIYLEKQFYKYLDENIPVSPDKFACKKDILLNSLGQGTLGRVHYWNEITSNIVVDQHITIIRAKEGFTTPEFLYLLLSSDEYYDKFLASVTGSTGMQMLNISAVRETNIPLVDYTKQSEFSKLVEPMFEKISNNTLENEMLALLRDQLLPKLMSGEIDVTSIDI